MTPDQVDDGHGARSRSPRRDPRPEGFESAAVVVSREPSAVEDRSHVSRRLEAVAKGAEQVPVRLAIADVGVDELGRAPRDAAR